jgi:hypothetical protein
VADLQRERVARVAHVDVFDAQRGFLPATRGQRLRRSEVAAFPLVGVERRGRSEARLRDRESARLGTEQMQPRLSRCAIVMPGLASIARSMLRPDRRPGRAARAPPARSAQGRSDWPGKAVAGRIGQAHHKAPLVDRRRAVAMLAALRCSVRRFGRLHPFVHAVARPPRPARTKRRSRTLL